MLLGCNLSAMLPLSTFIKYHLLMMILLLLFLQKQSLAFAVYLFGIGTLHTGPGLKKKKHVRAADEGLGLADHGPRARDRGPHSTVGK